MRSPLIRVKRVEPFDTPVHVFTSIPEGEETPFEDYVVTLRPSAMGKELIAKPDESNVDTAAYSRSPNDPSLRFRVFLACAAPDKYTLQAGLKYSVEGIENVVWSDQEFIAYSPSKYYDWEHRVGSVALRGVREYEPSKDLWATTATPTVNQWIVDP